jgi:hypothetical protein
MFNRRVTTFDGLGQSVGGCLGSRAQCLKFSKVLSERPLVSGRTQPAFVGAVGRAHGLSGAKRMRLACSPSQGAAGQPCRVALTGSLPRDELLCGPAAPVSAWPYKKIGTAAQCQSLSFLLTPVKNPPNTTEIFLESPIIRQDGTLVFQTRQGMWGRRDFDVQMVDSGGIKAMSASLIIDVLSVNDAPTFTPHDVYLNEGSGYQQLTFSNDVSAGFGDVNQSLTFWFTYSDGGKGLFEGVPSMSIVGKKGVVSLTPVTGKVGVAVFNVTLLDDGVADTSVNSRTSLMGTFRVIVRGVNQPPKFTLMRTLQAERDGPQVFVSGFARNISPGREGEENQRLFFSLGKVEIIDSLWSPDGLFEMFRVTPDGSLMLQMATGRSGIFNVTVILRDSGGTAFGGQDMSQQMFELRVLPLSRPELRGPTQVRVPQAQIDVPAVFPTAFTVILGNKTLDTRLGLGVTEITNVALFSELPAISDAGTLTFTPRAKSSGSSVMRVSLAGSAGAQSSSIMFTIFVDSINDPPSFSLIPSVSVIQGSGLVRVSNVARDISAGPPDEAWQIVTFSVSHVTSSPNLVFLEPPIISENGTLSFYASPSSHGLATLTVNTLWCKGVTRHMFTHTRINIHSLLHRISFL